MNLEFGANMQKGAQLLAFASHCLISNESPIGSNASSSQVGVGAVWGLAPGGDIPVESLPWKTPITSTRHIWVEFKHCVKMRENRFSLGVRQKMSLESECLYKLKVHARTLSTLFMQSVETVIGYEHSCFQ